MTKKKVLFVINNFSFFISHRLIIAESLINNNYDVFLIVGNSKNKKLEILAENKLKLTNIKYYKTSFTNSGLSFFKDLFGLFQLIFFVLKIKPDYIHSASLKANIYAGITAKFFNIKSLIISISGMGYIFTGKKNFKKKIYKLIFFKFFRYIFKHPNKSVLVQNQDDRDFILNNFFLTEDEVVLIFGSGVDLQKFRYIKEKLNDKIVLFPARIVKDKGIIEFIRASTHLKKKFPEWKFVISGSLEKNNPSSLTYKEFTNLLSESLVEWYGMIEDMVELYSSSNIVCLPSYREGLPKSLIEAAAIGRPIVTTDTIGCREAILNKVTGELVKLYDVEDLIDKITILIKSKSLREKYGINGRKLAIEKFDQKIIIYQILNIYKYLSKTKY